VIIISVFNVELFVELLYTNVIDRNQVTWRPMETDIHEHGWSKSGHVASNEIQCWVDCIHRLPQSTPIIAVYYYYWARKL